MKKIRAAIVGYGNIGKYTLEAIEASPDMECVGIVRRTASKEGYPELADYPVVTDIAALDKVDVAILATPTRSCEEHAVKCLAMGINTVDSFDIHTSILDYRAALMPVAKEHGTVAIISAGWDPGSDSVVAGIHANAQSLCFGGGAGSARDGWSAAARGVSRVGRRPGHLHGRAREERPQGRGEGRLAGLSGRCRSSWVSSLSSCTCPVES